MKLIWITSAGLVVSLIMACTKPPEIDPQIGILEKKIEALQAELGKLDTAIANSESDPAQKAIFQEDKNLVESRKERLDKKLQKIRPAAPEGGGHGAPAQSGHH